MFPCVFLVLFAYSPVPEFINPIWPVLEKCFPFSYAFLQAQVGILKDFMLEKDVVFLGAVVPPFY